MAIDFTLRQLFDTTATIAKRTSTHTSGYPKPGHQTTSNRTTYRAKIERSADLVRTELGHEVVSRRKIYLYSSTGWTATTIPTPVDKVFLPSLYAPDNEPQIMMVQAVSDERGIHHIVLWC